MANSSTAYGDLNPEEIDTLTEDGLVRTSNVAGKRKVSAALLSPPRSVTDSSSMSHQSPSSSSASIRSLRFNPSLNHDVLEIPVTVLSPAALEFIGFEMNTATDIYNNWRMRPDPEINPDDLIRYAFGHIGRLNTKEFEKLSTAEAMTRIGLSQYLQDVFTNPDFSAVFQTESLYFWVRDTLGINYATLMQLQQRLKNHAGRKSSKRRKRGSIQDIFDPATPVSHNAAAAANITAINMTTNDHNLPESFVALDTQGPILPDHVVLYKGKAATGMPTQPFIESDGSLNMAALASHGGGDFDFSDPAWYWTPEKEVAELYRQWAEARCTYSETWLIRIQLSPSFINSLNFSELWFSANWKEYVWYCKKQKLPPAKFDSLCGQMGADVIRGPICTGVAARITRIDQSAVQQMITEDFLLRVPSSGAKATQWAFMKRRDAERLGQEIRGKVHIDITASRHAQEQKP